MLLSFVYLVVVVVVIVVFVVVIMMLVLLLICCFSFSTNHSAQFIAASVTSHVMYGVVLKTEPGSLRNTVRMNINLGPTVPVTRNGGAVNGRSACGAR